MKQSIFGLRSSVFGLRSSVFGLLIFLFSANQVEYTDQDKPTIKKRTSSRISPRMCTGLKYFCRAAVLVLITILVWTTNKQRNIILDKNRIINSKNEMIDNLKPLVDTYDVLHYGDSKCEDRKYYLYPNATVLEIGYFDGVKSPENFRPITTGNTIYFADNLRRPIVVNSVKIETVAGKNVKIYGFVPVATQ